MTQCREMGYRLVMEVDDNRRRRLTGKVQRVAVQELDTREARAPRLRPGELGSQELARPSRGELGSHDPRERAKQIMSPEVAPPAQPIPLGENDPADARAPLCPPGNIRASRLGWRQSR